MANKESDYLPQKVNADGKLTVELEKDGKTETKLVDELVARTFLGPCPAGHILAHKDGDEMNCRADNLHYIPAGEPE